MPSTPSLRKEIGAGLSVAKNATSAVLAPVLEAPGVKQLGKAFGWAGEHIANVLMQNPQYATVFTKLAGFLDKNPEIADAISTANNILAIQGATSAVSGVVGAGASAVRSAVSGTGDVLKTMGEKATGIGVGMEVPTRMALQAYQATKPTLIERVSGLFSGEGAPSAGAKPITEANTAARLIAPGTEWQLGVHAKRAADSLWSDTISPALDTAGAQVDMRGFFKTLADKITTENADLTRRNVLLNALKSLRSDYTKVNHVSYSKLQDYKQGWAKFVPERAYKGQPIAGNLNEVRNLAAQQARMMIYDRLGPDIKQAYLDYGNLKSIQEAGIKSVDALRSKGVTKQIWEAIMDKAVTPIATTLGKVLYKTGEGLEFIGEPGAKRVRDIIQPSTAAIIPASVNANQPR